MTPRLLLALTLAGCVATGPSVRVRDAYSYQPVLGDVAAVYFTVENRGATADTLTRAEVPGALVAMIHEQVTEGDRVEMRHVGPLPLPGHGTVALRPGGLHLMVEGFARSPVAGDTLLVTVHFARAGVATVRAPVLPYGTDP
jgi:copper(I)-binding protein